MAKIVSLEEAVAHVQDGMTLAIGGFLGCGNPHKVIDALVEKGVKDLTIIANDSPATGYGLAKLIDNHQVKRLIASHVGLNPNVASQWMTDGTLDVWLIPQGSLVEMMRAAGGGLGGVITPTGLGTMVEESPLVDSKIVIDGKEYLVMKPVKADVALICGYKVDKAGNVWYKGTARNYSVQAATCADVVICEADNVVEIGEIEPENVMTQGIFVDYIVDGGKL